MKVKTGEEYVVRIPIDIQYKCSSCGSENLCMSSIKGSAYTGTILGANINRNLHGSAVNDLKNRIESVSRLQFADAGLTCCCENCGHVEPWARMDYEQLDKAKGISVATMIISGLVLIIGIMSAKSFSIMHAILLSIMFLSVIAWIGIRLYKSKHKEKMETLISALPKDCLPRIFPHSRERHKAFAEKKKEMGRNKNIQYF